MKSRAYKDFVASMRALSVVPKWVKVDPLWEGPAVADEEHNPAPALLRRVVDTGSAIVEICSFLGFKDAVSLCSASSKSLARLRGSYPWMLAILTERIASKWRVANESLVLSANSEMLGDLGGLGHTLSSFRLVSFPAPSPFGVVPTMCLPLASSCPCCGCRHEQLCGACARENVIVEAWDSSDDLYAVSCEGCRYKVVLRARTCLGSLECQNLTMQTCELCHTPTQVCSDCETSCSVCDKVTCDNCHAAAGDGQILCDDCSFFCGTCNEWAPVEDEYTSCEACNMASCRDCFDGLICEGPNCHKLLW